jgi:NADH dehydrogenase
MRLLDKHDRHDIEVTVLAPEPELRVRPRFYESDVHLMRVPLSDLFQVTGVRFVKGFVQKIDVNGKTVSYRNEQGDSPDLAYSVLVLAAGSHVKQPDLAGFEAHAFNVDKIDEASRLEDHIKSLGSLPDTPARNTVVIAGGGFTGIETACEMPARLRDALGEDADVRVIIVDRGADVGASLGKEISTFIVEATTELGVQWQLNACVAAVDEDGVTLADGQRIEAKTVIWTVGVQASELTSQIPAERDTLGRLHVDRNLRVIGQADVFATGDTAYAATDDVGNHALMTCQHAIALGRSAGNNAAAQLLGVAPLPYSQVKYVTCLDLGAWGAVFSEGWDRQVKFARAEGKQIKTQINTQWIYPPIADRSVALAAADPLIPVVA